MNYFQEVSGVKWIASESGTRRVVHLASSRQVHLKQPQIFIVLLTTPMDVSLAHSFPGEYFNTHFVCNT